MKVTITNAEGEMRMLGNGKPNLMHAVDALRCVKNGTHRAVYSEVTIMRDGQPIKRNVLTGIKEKTVEDRQKELQTKRDKLKKDAQALEKETAEVDAQVDTAKKDGNSVGTTKASLTPTPRRKTAPKT